MLSPTDITGGLSNPQRHQLSGDRGSARDLRGRTDNCRFLVKWYLTHQRVLFLHPR